MIANALLYICINLVSMYTKYLTDCAQRNAFLETRRSIETRYKIEKENAKQVRFFIFYFINAIQFFLGFELNKCESFLPTNGFQKTIR